MSYLTVQDYQRLRGLKFSPRRPPLGQRVGIHDSPVQGFNVEFSEYRAYTPGDDVKRLDWKVYGRTNRLMVKRHEHQTSLNVALLIDGSPSMDYRGEDPKPLSFRRLLPGSGLPPPLPGKQKASKYDHACRMAMAIAFVLLQQKDRVAVGVSGDGLRFLSGFRSSYRHLNALDQMLQKVPGQQIRRAGLPESLRALHHRIDRRSMVLVFSDFLEREEEVLQEVRTLRSRGDEVVLFHVLHSDEVDLPTYGPVLLRDSETGQTIPLSDPTRRRTYREQFEIYLRSFQSACKREGVDYHFVSSDQPAYLSVQKYMKQRVALR